MAPSAAAGPDAEAAASADAAAELRNVLDFMLDEHLKAQQTAVLATVGSDPQALERYKALERRRLELRQRLARSRYTG